MKTNHEDEREREDVHPIAGQRLIDADKKTPHLHIGEETENLKSSDRETVQLAFKNAVTGCLAFHTYRWLRERRGGALTTIPKQCFQEVIRELRRILSKRGWVAWLWGL